MKAVSVFHLLTRRRRSNLSILKEINPKYSSEGLMLKLKLQYFGHLMERVDSSEKTLMLGKTEGRGKEGDRDEMVGWHHRLNGHELGQTSGDGDGQGGLVCCSPWGCEESDLTWQRNNNNQLFRVRNLPSPLQMGKGHREGCDPAKEPQKVPAELCLGPGSPEPSPLGFPLTAYGQCERKIVRVSCAADSW